MASLAELPKLVGFFSYSREDDEDFRGELSSIRAAIGRNLAALLGRSKRRNFHLWQDVEAIAPGKMWEAEIAKAIEESVFFIPIVTPRAVGSPYCKSEFESFLAREQALGRNDLVFPILYIPVPALRDEVKWRNDRVLTIVAQRQFVDWRSFRYDDVNATAFGREIGRFCENIVETLHETWSSPDKRRDLEDEARRRTEDEAQERERAEAKRSAKKEERVRHKEAMKTLEALEAEMSRLLGRENEASHTLVKVTPLTAAQERALKPGDSFREGMDCPEMVVVPAGRFLMGSPARQGDDDEHPEHEVTIAKPFAVAKFALTFDEWDGCAAAGGCRSDVSDSGWGRGRRPVINVSWGDAQAYVKWLSGITGKPYRLLSEAEYEYAARAGTQLKYPWGDDIELGGKAMANCDGCGSQWDDKQTASVGSFAANAFGLYEMVGNVWEWMEDCWNRSYEGAPTDGSTWTSGNCSCRVVRGGSWYDGPGSLRSAYRHRNSTDNRSNDLGFRVARTLGP
jgi:formylglycine-generating enzyme required for sulfatase activity